MDIMFLSCFGMLSALDRGDAIWSGCADEDCAIWQIE